MANLRPTHRLLLTITTLIGLTMSESSLPAANYDEAKVPKYELPDPLTMQDGTKVKSASNWIEKRRPEVLELFREHVYGHSPKRPRGLKFKVIQNDTTALEGQAIRREVLITFARKEATPEANMLIYLPKDADGPVPAFLTINFVGNHTIHPDPGISISRSWVRNSKDWGIENNRADDRSRGARRSRWAVEKILKRGYALATIYYGDIDPDYDDDLLIAISIPVASLIVAGSHACVNNLPFCPGAFCFAPWRPGGIGLQSRKFTCPVTLRTRLRTLAFRSCPTEQSSRRLTDTGYPAKLRSL